MRVLFLTILTVSTFSLFGQNGYIKLDNDSTLVGYLRYYVAIKDGHQGIELWRTKKDKEPLKIPKWTINEYAIKSDTFKVLHQFKPFYDTQTYFELVDAKLKSSGKVNLYVIENYQNANRVSTYTGGGLIPAIIDESLGNHTYMYILEDKKTGFLKALPSKKEELKESLMDFFPEKYIMKYDEVKGEINYKSIPDLVKLYNSK
jgi:hypothetical protein